MAHLIGGIGSSHAPSLGTAWDKAGAREPHWAAVFNGYVPAKRWLETERPDLLVIFYNNHVNGFFFDSWPTIALGTADTFVQADEGWGKRPVPDLHGDPDFAWHVSHSLIEDEFDLTICQDMAVDHGIFSVLPIFGDVAMALPVVPIAINVIQHPLPTARRLFRLGQGVRPAIDNYRPDKRVLIMSIGGLSHQLHGERFGMVNQEWDNRFMDQLEAEPETLAALAHTQWMERGGTEGVEMMLWLAMRSALGPTVRRIHRNYAAPMTTGLGLLALAPA